LHISASACHSGGAAQACLQWAAKEVIYIDENGAILIVAVITAAIAFAMLVLKIVEVSRSK